MRPSHSAFRSRWSQKAAPVVVVVLVGTVGVKGKVGHADRAVVSLLCSSEPSNVFSLSSSLYQFSASAIALFAYV